MGNVLPALFASLFRVVAYVFLQVIPTRLAVPALPLLYVGYLLSLSTTTVTSDEVKLVENGDKKQKPLPPLPKKEDVNPLFAVFTGLKTRSRLPNITNVVINTALLVAALDLALSPLVYPENDVVFTRIGAVYPDAAKIMVRYPAVGNDTLNEVQILYKETLADGFAWKDGPVVSLTPENDWVNVTKLTGLWPNTEYEYIFASPDGVFLPYPAKPIHFQTFPDPRLNAGSHFKFLVSSCITPNFPYRGPHERRTIAGFDFISQSLAPRRLVEEPSHTDVPAPTPEEMPEPTACNADDAECSEPPAPQPENEAVTEDIPTTEAHKAPVKETWITPMLPKFMLFLGDFIYADVPVYFGADDDAYTRLYRRNYASPSFRKIYEWLPMLHVYDDHEIINNWGGDGQDLSPYPEAVRAFTLYNGAANYDSPSVGDHYFNFTYGNTAFFVMDTRRWRSDVEKTEAAERTMLGERQIEAFSEWLGKVNNTASFKFIISSVPFTSLWGHDAQKDSWGGYAHEKNQILAQLHTVPNVYILSGDRHEFAAIEFLGPSENSHTVTEFSTSPLNMFYIPFVRTLHSHSGPEDTVVRTRTEVDLVVVESEVDVDGEGIEENVMEKETRPVVRTVEDRIPRERVVEYIGEGNVKWSSIEVDTRNRTRPVLRLETWIDGRVAYEQETVGTPVKGSTALISLTVPSTIKNLLEKIGFQSKQWF